MSLFARPQDQLLHVLVQPADFEGCPEFWFPTGGKRLVKHRDGRSLDASAAQIELTLIPFIRVRDRLESRLLTHNLDYAAHVNEVNASLANVPLFLQLTTVERRVRVGDVVDFTLPNTEFSLYQLMAEWRLNRNSGAGPGGIGDGHVGWLTAQMFREPERYRPNPVQRFIEIHEDTFKRGVKRGENMLNVVTPTPANGKQRRNNEERFAQWKSRLISTLQHKLGRYDIADRFGAPQAPIRVSGNRVVFGLRLEEREIVIRDE